MTEKNCLTCVFYEPPKSGTTCGTCGYPVPEYLTVGLSGGNFLGHPAHTGTNCATYKSRIDLVDEAKTHNA